MPQVLRLESEAASARKRITAHVEDRECRKRLLLEAVERYRAEGVLLDFSDYERVGGKPND